MCVSLCVCVCVPSDQLCVLVAFSDGVGLTSCWNTQETELQENMTYITIREAGCLAFKNPHSQKNCNLNTRIKKIGKLFIQILYSVPWYTPLYVKHSFVLQSLSFVQLFVLLYFKVTMSFVNCVDIVPCLGTRCMLERMTWFLETLQKRSTEPRAFQRQSNTIELGIVILGKNLAMHAFPRCNPYAVGILFLILIWSDSLFCYGKQWGGWRRGAGSVTRLCLFPDNEFLSVLQATIFLRG